MTIVPVDQMLSVQHSAQSQSQHPQPCQTGVTVPVANPAAGIQIA